MTSFKDEQIVRLVESGWARCPSVAEAVARAGLPAVTPDYLAAAFPGELWDAAEEAVLALGDHFASARFADETTYGILLVPDPGKLDTRRPMTADVRADQLGTPVNDVFDDRLPAGVLGVRNGVPWTMVATVTNPRWTFTLFPGEGRTSGLAESGTVLKGKVRFRLGKPDRGIGSARVAPAIAVV
ncbi:hypothetical protein ACQEVF_22525 [Nonomuraea polychroma]|uniref:hypothetical protein n=1 Tax=Nonomuraea polychroma TaxID=46176 RepID=UPI003D92B622